MTRIESVLTRAKSALPLLALAGGMLPLNSSAATTVRVTIENLAPDQGTILTPFWVGFHDGSFDLFDHGAPASAAVERFAEDGDFAALLSDFAGSSAGSTDGILTGLGMEGTPPLFFPGQVNSWTVTLDETAAENAYFSYASMILPSNDAFVANGNPTAYPIFDAEGAFLPQSFIVSGLAVRDAGTEVNDEVAANVPVLGQMAPDSGVAEGGVISAHPGFARDGAILTAFPNAEFLQDGYQIARITIEEVPPRIVTLQVSFESLSPDQGLLFTPVWFGFHDGSFDVYEPGEMASAGLERVAEDGSFDTFAGEFAAAGAGDTSGILTGFGMEGTPPLFFPGQRNTWTVNVDANNPQNRYLSYLAMILPSNDAFIGNNNPMALEIFDADGNFQPIDRMNPGRGIWDAGTEVNDEIASNVPVLGQMAPDTGVAENGVITRHPGFVPAGNVLASFPNAAFTGEGYQAARITVTELNNPFVDVPAQANGIKQTETFGRIYDAEWPALWQEDHGWFLTAPTESDTVFWAYNYQDNLGWIRIDLALYPLVFHPELGYLFYFEGSTNPRFFYDFAAREWITVPSL